ncbi:MAG: trypsin-like peptidase domain-containing protein [Planctomycetota bacterium]
MTPARLFLAFVLLVILQSDSQANDFDIKSLGKKIEATVDRSMPSVVAVRNRFTVFSAVIISNDGYMLSAGHAVSPGRTYAVYLADGRRTKAVGLGFEPRLDCAMLKITEGNDWPFAEMGDSQNLSIDQPVIGISHPGLLNPDRGAVVRFGRITKPITRNEGMILSTVKIEPGDSGGPLFDLDGKVIGIHSNIRRDADENYAVPVNTYKKFKDELLKMRAFDAGQWVAIPKLGFRGRESFDSVGLEVVSISEGGLAEDSGLQVGDVILEMAGKVVDSTDRFRTRLIDLKSRGTSNFTLRVMRDDQRRSLEFDVSNQKEGPISYPQLEDLPSTVTSIESRLDDISCKVTSQLNGKTSTSGGIVLVSGQKGNILTKSSLVGDRCKVKLSDGRQISGKVIQRDAANDLALIYIHARISAGIDFRQIIGDMPEDLGKFLLSPSIEDSGQVSVWSSNYFRSPKSRASGGYLGVQIGLKNDEVYFPMVQKNGASALAGIKPGDILLKLDNVSIRHPNDVFAFLTDQNPEQTVTATVRRGDNELEKTVKLGRRPEMSAHVADHLVGGKSVRRDGFSNVISHDADLKPDECGGPVFDLNGNLIGMNISRYSRTQTYILTRSVLKQFVEGSGF